MARCRSCRRPIDWVRTDKGKMMPLDPDPVSGGNVVRIGVKGGTDLVHVLRQDEMDLAEPPRYVAHWATCPTAEEHRT